MDVGFRDPRTQRLFNEHAKLEARYGAALALKAAVRLAVLAAASDLSALPSAPPIGFKPVGDGEGYAVDLGAACRLRFVGLGAAARRGGDLSGVRSIEVLGIETLDVAVPRRR